MTAYMRGRHLGFKLRPTLEAITKEEYRVTGRKLAEEISTTERKQQEFMMGWFAVNQAFFGFLKDASKRRIVKAVLTVVCDTCGSVVEVEIEGKDIKGIADEKYATCPVCEEKE